MDLVLPSFKFVCNWTGLSVLALGLERFWNNCSQARSTDIYQWCYCLQEIDWNDQA